MERMMKKSLSVLLTFVVLLGLMPAAVFAQEADPETPETPEIVEYTAPENVLAEPGTEKEELELPGPILAAPADETKAELPVERANDPKSSGDLPGEDIPAASLGDEYALAGGVDAPEFTVTAEEKENPAAEPAAVAAYALPENITAAPGTGWEALGLPASILATLADGAEAELPVEWTSDPEYSGDLPGEYILTAFFGDGYALAEGVAAPVLTVTVEGDEIDSLIAGIDALPGFDQEAVDVEDDEAFEQWLEEQYAVYAGVPALYEQLMSFAEDEEAMARVGGERANKLAEIYTLLFANMPQLMAGEQAQWGTSTNYGNSGTLADAVKHANNSNITVYIQLLSSVNTTAVLAFNSGTNTVLDLNGYTINRGLTSAESNGNVITVNGTLTIKDSRGGGNITGGNTTGRGAGVLINNGGKLYMEGGKISGNKSGEYGGGVMINNSGALYMSGGEISSNSVADRYPGGGVYVFGEFHMSGGKISSNTASFGGGMYIAGTGKFYMSGDAQVSDNTAYSGGGLYVSSSLSGQGVCQISGGTISGNEATADGGGAYMQGGLLTLSNMKIINNTTTSGNGSGIFFKNHTNKKDGVDVLIFASFSVSGNVAISDNKKSGVQNNLYLGTVSVSEAANPNVVKVIGNFSGDIGVTTEAQPTFHTPVNIAVSTGAHTITSDEAACFTPDDGKTYYSWADQNNGNMVKFYTCSYVTYNKNGATGGTVPTDSTKYHKDNHTVTVEGQNTLAKTGYSFGGWNTEAGGGGTSHAAGSTFEIDKNVTLYA
ncbi:MAG: InlB B-repeat-containing protein [Oscillospiraceae bacterium]|nr:InlB B-repeat-containing protein [Oscillospiraceae bacterium]